MLPTVEMVPTFACCIITISSSVELLLLFVIILLSFCYNVRYLYYTCIIVLFENCMRFNVILCELQPSCLCYERSFTYTRLKSAVIFVKSFFSVFFYEKAKIVCVEVVLCLLLARARKQYFYTYRLKASDTLDSFLSKVAFESDFRKKTCTCDMKTFAIFLISKETFTIRTCPILESFFRKLLSKATLERKLSSVSLPLVLPMNR